MVRHRIRIGIIGAGGYGRSARQYLRNTSEYDIVACMDVRPAAARAAAREENAASYTDLQACLAHEGLEAVSINTPVLLHARHARAALEAGKHVFMTKPVANRSRDALQLLRLAEHRNLALMIGHHARHGAAKNFVRKMVKGKTLGRVCNVVATSCSSGGLEQKAGDWRVQPNENPGGPMLQCGIHTIDFLISLFGNVTRVMAMMRNDITPFEVADDTLTLLAFEDGTQAALASNYTTAYMHTLDVFGTRANLHVHEHITGLRQSEMYLQRRARGPHEPWEALRIPQPRGRYPDPHGGVLERDFASQIRSGKTDYANMRDAIQALRVVEAAVRSHRTGKAVALRPFPARPAG